MLSACAATGITAAAVATAAAASFSSHPRGGWKRTKRRYKVREKLLRANPDSAQAARDVVVSHLLLARFYAAAKDAPSAAKHR